MLTFMEMPKIAKIVYLVLTRVPSRNKTQLVLLLKPIAQIKYAPRTLTTALPHVYLAEQEVLLMPMVKKL